MNKEDMFNYNSKNEYIFSSLANSLRIKDPNRRVSDYLPEYAKLCFGNKRKYALDSIIGHIGGQKLSVHSSPWVSTSKDYFYTLSEYAVPQAGNFNYEHNRKPVIVLDMPDYYIYDNYQSIKKLRDEVGNINIAIDLAGDKEENNLNNYYDNDAILAEKYNEDMPGYVVTDPNDEYNTKTKVSGFNNFAIASKEVLVYGGIHKSNIKIILYPILADILYTCNYDFDNNIDYLVAKKESLEFVFKSFYMITNPVYNNKRYLYDLYCELYPSLETGNNLTDYLVKHYNSIPGNDIETKYKELMKQKYELLNEIINAINIYCNINLKAVDLVDKKVLVKKYQNIQYISSKLLNDVILIEHNNKIYQYNHNNHSYLDNDNNAITKGDALKLIRKRPI